MATVKEFRMSQERYDELKKELDYSKTTRADEIAELIKEARGFGDLSENSEYDEAKNEQGKLYSRIAELEEILLHAVIVDESEMDSDKISIGCRVVVTNLDNGKQLPIHHRGLPGGQRHGAQGVRGFPLRQGPDGHQGR
ncbi:MAG: hypothetical protein V8S97_06720 [Oscillospiraceae bacterium]